jgi:tripartite-type tricarboxylate transporter receptor subunit TctC
MILKHLALAAALVVTCATAADDYPHKPIRIIDPYAPGGSTEAQARALGAKLTEAWGEPVVIDGRPGAGSAIGSQIVANAAPDGYTLLFNNAAIGTTANMMRKPLYDPVKDLAAVILVGTQAFFLVAHPSMPATLKDLIALAKAKPGAINFASAGSGGASHLAMEYLKSLAHIDIVHVPYKGSAPSSTALIAGEVQIAMFSGKSVLPHVQAGRLRALGVSTLKRSAVLPDVPPIAEAGVPGYEVVQWSGIYAPAGTPRAIVVKLNREINEALKLPDVRERFANIGVEPAGSTPEAFAAYTVAEVRKWKKVIDDARIPRQ